MVLKRGRKKIKKIDFLSRRFDISEIFYIFAVVRKKGVIMLMFLACLAVVGVFVIIEVVGNAIKNTEESNDEEENR